MEKEKILERLKQLAADRERAKQDFYKTEGMILAYEQLLKEVSEVGA